ncbi:MAG: tRNA (N6-threonylcarbamoyladenosine(37)-N6)-methyltransferase TrmO [Spirochaetes bacterium]|nr:tRNA (N6-threonylcarbamoyladenosine(37)-N6)-methyltransferase TrmO [Spirochaetota bacterium]
MGKLDKKRLGMLLDYMQNHGKEHVAENERWLAEVKELGLSAVAEKLEEVARLEARANLLIGEAKALLDEKKHAAVKEDHGAGPHHSHRPHHKTEGHLHIQFHPIGVIRTPYTDRAPRQPDPDAEGDFRIVLDDRFAEGLFRLEKHEYINVLFFLDRSSHHVPLQVMPHGSPDPVGVFGSRSPVRPNPIGLSTVRIKSVSGNTVRISGIDALDRTPLIDIKPYIEAIDRPRSV